MGNNERWARDRAVGVHDERARQFSNEYAHEDVFKSPFRYGRSLIDKRWAQVLSEQAERASVLDIGCGTGHYAQLAMEKGLDVWAVEPSREMRDLAAAKLPSEKLSDGSVLELPFEDERFSFVYQIEVLRYLNQIDNVAAHQQIFRVLKPGGYYFGTYVNRYALDGYGIKVMLARFMAALRGQNAENHVEFETPVALKKKLERCGFSNVEVHGAMLAPLRIIYKFSPALGEYIGKRIFKSDETISDLAPLRAFSGHLIVIARR